MFSNEELHAWRADAEWLATLADVEAGDYPLHITENSRVNSVCVIAAVDAELAWRESKGISKPTSPLGWDRTFLDSLKMAVPIEEEVSRSVSLKKRGTSLSGLCPFHNDRNPSLVVWPDSQRWRCFGCGVHGDVFSWVQAITRMSFSESVHYLAAMAGVDMPKRRGLPKRERPVKRSLSGRSGQPCLMQL